MYKHALTLFSPGLLILTLIRAIQDWRTNTSRMHVVLVNHNISYYACDFLNIFTAIFQFSGLDSCNPRHAHAPPSLAGESTSTGHQWRRRFDVQHLICKSHGVMSYPVSYSVPFMEQIWWWRDSTGSQGIRPALPLMTIFYNCKHP
ncbi:uncharacterized protein F5147DRAFT_653950 [Suillus discolor]|uniref:Uncharacterized protein n=1 Tax=Suillus discolor TaxID=1912936 RepID=A0A9P7JSV3_9AGAM|nr:uncharacterized protein F5147DRAFT_653950 [Suillus discolor]KAG2106196.1 hypothetical protein F5147DRAFT_653950 [Suillus discolor]